MEMSLINTIVSEEDVIYEEDFNEESSNISSENEEEVYITKNTSVETILHSLTPIEYPPTSINGIQYSMGKPCGQHNTSCSYLGNVVVTKKDRTCQGLKICEFASSELLEMTHKTVEFNSDLRLKISEELFTDNVKTNTFVKWRSNEKYHRFISIQENTDLNLLRQLLDGLWEGESDEPINNCFTVLHNSLKKIYCPYPHCERNIVKQGSIIQKTCNVKYLKLIPLDIKKCPYMILVSRRIHSHPPPPPNRVPITIRDRLQELIHQANNNTGDVTPTRIISGNLIKTYFGTEYLAEVHVSLNNADRLRYHVDKIQKKINPQGTDLLGVVYNYSKNINNFCEYVKRLEFFEDNHIMIICTTPKQLSE
ncbi:hypothetical protein Glove_122g77 [Diversispora epigaea]|uniref:Uncharacterized protein n=1 Tax=Diversispora epigaea TaxID=1348612 RepID=A0A397J2R3_9GLOM|nr:hypothetical protein Glove_122g77 [Diversispora epigaea]